MATQAQQVMYRDEFIAGFETRQSILRDTVTTDTMTKGASTYFLISRPNRTAVTRGANGLIPASMEDLTQVQVTMQERHDLTQKTNFNVFAGQSDQRRIMQMESMGVINRDIDLMILATLNTATQTTNGGAATTMSKTLINNALTRLWNGKVPNDGQIYGLLSPAAWMYLSDVVGFSSRDYVDDRPLVTGPEQKRWMGVTWMMSPEVPGNGTNNSTCFLWHKSALGHAVDTKGIQALADYNSEQDYSWARTTFYHGTAVLQNTGIVKIPHNDQALSQ